MGNILCTGGTGFVGKWLQKTQSQELSAVYLSSSDYESQLWKTQKYTHIIHAANISPTEVIEQAKACNARLLYISSGIVHHPENNIEYRRNKIKWEWECLDSGVDVVIARLFTFYGEGLDDNKAVVQFKKAAKEGKPLKIWGDGKTVRSYLHGRDMAKQIWAILLHGKSREAYDVGADEPVTMLQLAELCVAGRKPKPEIIIQGGVDPMPVYLPVDTAKTKALLTKMKT